MRPKLAVCPPSRPLRPERRAPRHAAVVLGSSRRVQFRAMESRKGQPLARAGAVIADWSERLFPDAYVFALAAIVVVFLFGLAAGEKPLKLVDEFGNGFWVLVPFTMQMALIIITGFVVASSPPIARLIERL